MVVKCYNCGKISPDKEEWELTKKLKWMAVGKFIRGKELEDYCDSFLKTGESPKVKGEKWFCKECSEIGFDLALGLPIRIDDRRQ